MRQLTSPSQIVSSSMFRPGLHGDARHLAADAPEAVNAHANSLPVAMGSRGILHTTWLELSKTQGYSSFKLGFTCDRGWALRANDSTTFGSCSNVQAF